MKLKKSKKKQLPINAAEEIARLKKGSEQEFEAFCQTMRPHLEKVASEELKLVLKDLYRLAQTKKRMDRFTEQQRVEAGKLRAYRVSLVQVEKSLQQALTSIARIAKKYPQSDEIELLFDGEDVRTAIIEAAKRLALAIEMVKRKQPILAAMIQPKLRTALEASLVAQELFPVSGLPIGEKSREIDLWFVSEAAKRLRRCRTESGKGLPGLADIIAQLFRSGFGQIKTTESIRKYLDRERSETASTGAQSRTGQ